MLHIIDRHIEALNEYDYLHLISHILESRDSSTHIVKVYIPIISSTHRVEWLTDKAMSA